MRNKSLVAMIFSYIEVEKSPSLKETLKDSIEPVKSLISSQFMRLSLKKLFCCFYCALDHEIDASLTISTTSSHLFQESQSKEYLEKFSDLKQFMNHCCGKTYCSICSLLNLKWISQV